MLRRSNAINRLRLEFRNIVNALAELANAESFEGEESNWKKFLHSFDSNVRTLRHLAKNTFNDPELDQQIWEEVISHSGTAHPALRYLTESRNNLVHHDEKGFILPWSATQGIYQMGGFGLKYDPLIVPAEPGSLKIEDCYSHQTGTLNFEVKPSVYGPVIEGVDKRFVKHKRPRLTLSPAYDRKLNEISVPRASQMNEQIEIDRNATPYECAEFAVGYLYACIDILRIGGIAAPFELKRA